MTPETLDKRARQKAATREKILTMARRLFDLHGYDGVDVRTIARRVGLSTGAIFQSWPDKASLYKEAMGWDQVTLAKAAEAYAKAQRDGDFDDLTAALKAFFKASSDEWAFDEEALQAFAGALH